MSVTYTNDLYTYLAPVLLWVRKTGFFEAYVFMPLMSALAIALFFNIKRVAQHNGTFQHAIRARFAKTWLFSYFSLCFILTNAIAVAFKTMIFEETDYTQFHWFVPWVSPLHFYITSVTAAMLWLIARNRQSCLDIALCLYIQVGFVGGYGVATYRLVHEPFDLLDPTTGISSLFFYLWLGVLNLDLIMRFPSAWRHFSSLKLSLISHRSKG
jgi:hypothetical protein